MSYIKQILTGVKILAKMTDHTELSRLKFEFFLKYLSFFLKYLSFFFRFVKTQTSAFHKKILVVFFTQFEKTN